MASETELAGRVREPETFKLVVVTLVPLALTKAKLVIVPMVVRLGREVEAEIAKNVLVAEAVYPTPRNDEVAKAG